MEGVGIILGVFVGFFVAAQSVAHVEDSAVSQEFSSLSEGVAPFAVKKHFAPIPIDAIFSSWPMPSAHFRLLDDWPPIPIVPRVEVSCDHSKLQVLVWKDFAGVTLTAEQVQLGDGCYRTSELPTQLVFSYRLDECGTSYVVS